MNRIIGLGLALALVGCDGRAADFDATTLPAGQSTGWVDAPDEDPTQPTGGTETTSLYDGAWLEVISPVSGQFVPAGELAPFEAKLHAADGSRLDGSAIVWSSSIDPGWAAYGDAFDDDTLATGVHNLSANVDLPNGDHLGYTVGGVLVQSSYAGTYTGLFSVDGAYTGIVFTCSGSSTIIVEPGGRNGSGDADCLVSLLGIDLPLAFVFDLQNDAGVVTGTAGADLFGLLTYDFPAHGTLDPNITGLSIAFGDDVPLLNVNIDGTLDAARISRDAGL